MQRAISSHSSAFRLPAGSINPAIPHILQFVVPPLGGLSSNSIISVALELRPETNVGGCKATPTIDIPSFDREHFPATQCFLRTGPPPRGTSPVATSSTDCDGNKPSKPPLGPDGNN